MRRLVIVLLWLFLAVPALGCRNDSDVGKVEAIWHSYNDSGSMSLRIAKTAVPVVVVAMAFMFLERRRKS